MEKIPLIKGKRIHSSKWLFLKKSSMNKRKISCLTNQNLFFFKMLDLSIELRTHKMDFINSQILFFKIDHLIQLICKLDVPIYKILNQGFYSLHKKILAKC